MIPSSGNDMGDAGTAGTSMSIDGPAGCSPGFSWTCGVLLPEVSGTVGGQDAKVTSLSEAPDTKHATWEGWVNPKRFHGYHGASHSAWGPGIGLDAEDVGSTPGSPAVREPSSVLEL